MQSSRNQKGHNKIALPESIWLEFKLLASNATVHWSIEDEHANSNKYKYDTYFNVIVKQVINDRNNLLVTNRFKLKIRKHLNCNKFFD